MQYDLEKPDLNSLTHHGVMGMHWGHHRSIGITRKRQEMFDRRDAKRLNYTPNKNYPEYNQRQDKILFGSRGVKRISENMDKGLTLKEARRKQIKRTLITTAAYTIASEAAMYYAAHPGAFKRDVNAGKRATDSILSKIGSHRATILDASGKTIYSKWGHHDYTVRNAVSGLIKGK